MSRHTNSGSDRGYRDRDRDRSRDQRDEHLQRRSFSSSSHDHRSSTSHDQRSATLLDHRSATLLDHRSTTSHDHRSSSSHDHRHRSSRPYASDLGSRHGDSHEGSGGSYRIFHSSVRSPPPPPPPPPLPPPRGYVGTELVPFRADNDGLVQSETLIVPRIQQDKLLDGSLAISTLGRWCDRIRISKPEYTLSESAPFSAKLVIAGVEFDTEGFPTKAEAKRTVAWAAVEHFKRAGERFFMDEDTSIDWVSALMSHCAANDLGKVRIDVYLVSDDPVRHAGRVHFGGRVLEYTDLYGNSKQVVKAHVAKMALEAIRSGKFTPAKHSEAPIGHLRHSKHQVQYPKKTPLNLATRALVEQERDIGLRQPSAFYESDSTKYDPARPTSSDHHHDPHFELSRSPPRVNDPRIVPYASHAHSPPSADHRPQSRSRAGHGHRDDKLLTRVYNDDRSKAWDRDREVVEERYNDGRSHSLSRTEYELRDDELVKGPYNGGAFNSAFISSRKRPRDEDADDINYDFNRRSGSTRDNATPFKQVQTVDSGSSGVVQALLSSLVWGNATKRTCISSGSEDEFDAPAPAANTAAGTSSSSSADRQGITKASQTARFPSYANLLDIACYTRHLPEPRYADLHVGNDAAAIGGYRCSVTVDGETFDCMRVHEKRETAKEDVAGDAYKWLLKRDQVK
ncbi:hypothetical protein HDU86_004495 [Geranomyces michiganensis]|nr:hypothetical protein HDU86_004495 [Geranomyces michiganensis]